MTSHREILYGPLHGALRCDIFQIFMAISMHYAAFHKIIRFKFHYEALISYVSCILNPRRHGPFRILPRHKGEVGTTPPPLAVSPLNKLKFREKKNERVARRETKRLIYKLKVLGQPVTSEIRSSAEK